MPRSLDDDSLDDEMIKRIDARSDELDADLRRFIAATLRRDPDADPETAMTWWIVQKLSGLQILAEELNRQIGRVGKEMDRRTKVRL